MTALALSASAGGSRLKVRAVPGAKVERVVGVHGDALKIAVQAPPERGRANERLLEVLAAALRVPVRALAVAQGAASRDKIVSIAELAPADVLERLGLAR